MVSKEGFSCITTLIYPFQPIKPNGARPAGCYSLHLLALRRNGLVTKKLSHFHHGRTLQKPKTILRRTRRRRKRRKKRKWKRGRGVTIAEVGGVLREKPGKHRGFESSVDIEAGNLRRRGGGVQVLEKEAFDGSHVGLPP